MGLGLKRLGLNRPAYVKANFLSEPIRNRARSVLDPKTFGVERASEFAHVLRVAMKRRKVEFSSHTANLALLRNCVRDFLNGYPFSEKQRLLMVLGVDEACTNVIRYAYRLRDDQLISLRMEGLRKCVRMRLRDYGEQVLPHQMKGRSHDIIKPGGLGLYLIRNAFDQVDYIHKRRGTELVLTKKLE
jgi:anti-sigma regulatory factor (Ser/Thr protein kinase)